MLRLYAGLEWRHGRSNSNVDRVCHRSSSNGSQAQDDRIEEVTVCGFIMVHTSIHLTRSNSDWPNGNDDTRASSIINLVFLFTWLPPPSLGMARRCFDLEKSAARFLGPKTPFLHPHIARTRFRGFLPHQPRTHEPPRQAPSTAEWRVVATKYSGGGDLLTSLTVSTQEPNLIVSGLSSPSATNPLPSLDPRSKPTQATTY